MKKFRQSVVIPACLVIYLAMMAYVGRENFTSGNKWFYCIVLAISLLIILLLHFVLKKKEQIRARRKEEEELNEQQYTTYNDEASGDASTHQ